MQPSGSPAWEVSRSALPRSAVQPLLQVEPFAGLILLGFAVLSALASFQVSGKAIVSEEGIEYRKPFLSGKSVRWRGISGVKETTTNVTFAAHARMRMPSGSTLRPAFKKAVEDLRNALLDHILGEKGWD